MPPDIHQRARVLILDQAVSAVDPKAAVWLEGHLEECVGCRNYAHSTREAIGTLRGISEMPSSTLVRATQRSVRLAAKGYGDIASQRRMLIVSCVLAAGWGTVMQPVLWRLFGWVGGLLDVPSPAWQAAFLAAWLLPGIATVFLLMHFPLPAWIRRGTYKGGNQ